jgi:hypothetical protein
MALGKRDGGTHVEAPAEEVSDKHRPRFPSHQPLCQVEARREGDDIEVHRHSDEPVRFDDADHVRMRDRGHEDLVTGGKVERIEEQVES